MINRRDFFKAFAAIGVTAALAEAALVRAVTDPVPRLSFEPSLFSGTEPYAELTRLSVATTEHESRLARMALIRTPGG